MCERSMTPAPPWMAMTIGYSAAGGGAAGSAAAAAIARLVSRRVTRCGMISLKAAGQSGYDRRRPRQRAAAALSIGPAVDLKVKAAPSQRIRSILVANRGEIAIRVMRAANELGVRTVAIYSQEDRFSLHRTKADEAYLVGRDRGPVEAYLDIEGLLRVAREARVDAIHPGYGFLAENPEFAQACAGAGIVFIGPTPQAMRTLGNKVAAPNLAASAGVPTMPATPPLPPGVQECAQLARGI